MKFFKKITQNLEQEPDTNNDFNHFYNQSSIISLRFYAFLLVPLMLFGSLFYFRDGHILFGVLEILIGAFIFAFVFFKEPSNQLKQKIILVLLFFSSIFIIITTGKEGGGFSSLLIVSVLILFLVRVRGFHKYYLILLGCTMALMSILLYTGVFSSFAIDDYRGSWPFMVVLTIIYVGFVSSLILFYKTSMEQQYSRVKDSEIYLQNVINSVSGAVLALDNDYIINYANEKATELFDFDDLTGVDFANKILKKFKSINIKHMPKAILNKDYLGYTNDQGEEKILTADSSQMYDNKGKLIGSIIVLEDISDIIDTEKRMAYLNTHDQLTGLYNRPYFEKKLNQCDTEQYMPLSMLLIDINGLQLINESFGTRTGDLFLIETANIIKACTKQEYEVARISGDQFVILMPNKEKDKAEKLLEELYAVSKTKKIAGLEISFSVGIASKTSMDISISDAYKKMENSMLQSKKYEGRSMRSKTIDLIMLTLYEKNQREMMHSTRVGELSEKLAEALGFSEMQVKRIRLSGLMHDIGKIAIQEELLNKDGKLTNEEWERIKQHPEIGYRILSSHNEFKDIAEYIREHHERYDGSGYPLGKKGEAIHKESRVIMIADSYDAMTTYRTYRPTLTKEEAIEELKNNKGNQFDPKYTDVFIEKVLKE